MDNHGNADIGPTNYPTTTNAFYSNVAESIQYSTTDSNGNTGGPQDEQAFLTVLSADLHSFVYSSLIGGGIIGGCGNGACNTNGIAIAVNAAGAGLHRRQHIFRALAYDCGCLCPHMFERRCFELAMPHDRLARRF